MTKMLKRASKALACTLAVVLTFVLTIGGVNASVPNTVTVKNADYTKDFINDNDSAMVMFKTTDEVTIYCMDINKKPLVQGQSATLVGDADAGVLYILKNGYPNKHYRNNNGMDAYITQMALWWYLDESKIKDSVKNATGEADQYQLIDAVKKLVAGARSAKDTSVTPSMNVISGDTNLSLTSDGKYYESGYLSASLTGAKTYNVSLTGNTKNTVVVDEGGNIGTTMNSGEKFKVRVPANEISNKTNITVKFAAEGKIEKARIYKPADNSYQRVVGVFEETKTLTKEVLLKANVKNVCTYKDGKYYGKKGQETDKKTYILECKHVCEFTDNKYYGKDGNEVDKKTYNKECSKSCEYTDGKYYGKDGSQVDKKEFEKQCKKSCEYYNGKYYGKEGNEVDQNTYNKECGQEVVVPNTSANISTLAIILGTIMMLSGTTLILYRRKMLF